MTCTTLLGIERLGIEYNITSATAEARSTRSEQPSSGGVDPRDPPHEADGDLIRLASLPAGPAREELREHIICAWLPAARRAARRYRHTGEPMEDLVQVATVGLIQAVDRFDPARGSPFRHFAMPTILGELKRHFRDKGWSVTVTRREQELHQVIRQAEPELAQRLRRMPTVADLAAHLNISESDVMAGRNVASAYSARSLNWRTRDEDDSTEVGELLGGEDHELDLVADRESLRSAMRFLPDSLRVLLTLRFVENLTQSQIAEEIGVSQMHVSRLIGRALAILRRHMLAEPPVHEVDAVTPQRRFGPGRAYPRLKRWDDKLRRFIHM